MDNIKISVIMPVYNVEDFVEKTIRSVLSQTLEEIEFFAINDGSTDRSGEICDQISKEDSRLKVIHKKNGGAPEARNVALKLAVGKYVYFIDSDDWIESDYLENMYNLAEKNDADVVMTGFFMEYYQNGQDITYSTECDNNVYSRDNFRKNAYKYLNKSLLSLPWNKLYRLKHIKEENISFPNTKWDDHHFNMDFFMNSNMVVTSSMKKYHWYRSRKGSETMINYSDPNMFIKRKEHFQHILDLYENWSLNDDVSNDAISVYYAGRLFQCVQELMDNADLTIKQKHEKVSEIINDKQSIEALQTAKSLSLKFKILTLPMKWRSVILSMIFGKAVSFIRNHFPKLFIRLKEKEVHS